MKVIVHFLILVGFALLCILGCVNREDRTRESSQNLNSGMSTFLYNAIPQVADAEITPEYSTAINTFSVNVLKAVYASADFDTTNVILSPFSVSRNLAVLAEASSGDSKQELLNALGGQKALDDARSALGELLYADNTVVFQCADAVWVDSTKYSIVDAFRDSAEYKFGVKTASLDFSNASEAASSINKWIYVNTNQKLADVIGADIFTTTTAAIVTNAVYFEADWASPFDIAETQSQEFFSPGGTVMVDMMQSGYLHDTYRTDTYDNAKLYYGTNDMDYFCLDVYMPKTITIKTFLQDSCLTALCCQDTNSQQRGSVKIPKFFFTTRCDLVPMLKQMGISRVFDPAAGEITGMVQAKSGVDYPLYIEKVIHEAGIKTDEEGTEAYSVTVGMTGATSAGPVSSDVVFDHPFVYFIRAGRNGLVLFAGVVNDPS